MYTVKQITRAIMDTDDSLPVSGTVLWNWVARLRRALEGDAPAPAPAQTYTAEAVEPIARETTSRARHGGGQEDFDAFWAYVRRTWWKSGGGT
jgi:hypothetical protein